MNTTMNLMTDDAIRAVAPSVFATRPWDEMSAKYTFIPTSDVVTAMRREGFQPVKAEQSRTRIEGKGEFTKHMLRFRDMRQGDAPVTRQLGTLYPEIVLTNSHDGASAYRLDVGLFRLVCMNGMVIGCAVGEQIAVRHTGSAQGVIEATYEVVDRFPQVMAQVEGFQRTMLSAPQTLAFGEAALELKYDALETPVTPAQLVRPTRPADGEGTLWNTLNVVQEKLLGGGGRGFNPRTGRRVTTRAVKGISESNRLNKALWTLAERMQGLVNA